MLGLEAGRLQRRKSFAKSPSENEKRNRALGGGANAAARLSGSQPVPDTFCFSGGGDFIGESCELFGGQRANEGFQNNLRFAEAGVEVILQAVKCLPAVRWLDGESLAQILGGIIEF